MMFLAIVERDYDEPMLFWELESNTKEDATKEFEAKMIGEWYEDDDDIGYDGGQIQDLYDLRSVLKTTLYEASAEFEMPLKKWFAESQQRTKQAKAIRNEQAERVEFERLKEKYDGQIHS